MKTIIRSNVKKLESLYQIFCSNFSLLLFSWRCLFTSFLNHLLHYLPSFLIHLFYFIFFSFIGFFFLKVSSSSLTRPSDLDLFFTSVSATSVSSMSTVEMEVFSNFQLIIITILMLIGGEVFVSLVKLYCSKYAMFVDKQGTNNIDSDFNSENGIVNAVDKHVEISLIKIDDDHLIKYEKPSNLCRVFEKSEEDESKYMNDSIKLLSYTILGYFLISHILCSFFTCIYFVTVPTAKQVLENKGIKVITFSVFVAVSSLANCGFIPTNENMLVFKKNSGLLLILTPQVLIGNTLFPTCLLLVIFSLKYFTQRPEFDYILKHYNKFGYDHLMSKRKCCYLGATVSGFILIQFLLFVSMEWNNSGAMDGLNFYQKMVASVFQVVNARHAGEYVFDLSTISPAVLVLFVTMMYLPPYTLFSPVKDAEICSSTIDQKTCSGKKKGWVQNVVLSQLTYLTIFIILICISEREKMKEDPINFSVFNIILEVISAYGNVGFSIGYSCKRQIKLDVECKDAYYGFAGKWSNTGKLILILVMLFGRLKSFHMGGGTPWKLS